MQETKLLRIVIENYVKCKKCEKFFLRDANKPVNIWKFILQNDDLRYEYAYKRLAVCEKCINDIWHKIEEIIGDMEVNSPADENSKHGFDAVDVHNKRVRDNINDTTLYKNKDYSEDDLPTLALQYVEEGPPRFKRLGFDKRLKRKIKFGNNRISGKVDD